MEGRFKFAHQRVRTHSESIAFFGGGDREREILKSRYQQMDHHTMYKILCDIPFNFAKAFFIQVIPGNAMWTIRFLYGLENHSARVLVSLENHSTWHVTLLREPISLDSHPSWKRRSAWTITNSNAVLLTMS